MMASFTAAPKKRVKRTTDDDDDDAECEAMMADLNMFTKLKEV